VQLYFVCTSVLRRVFILGKETFARAFSAEARYFLLRTQKKVPKEKGAQSPRRSLTGPLRASKNRALRNSRDASHYSATRAMLRIIRAQTVLA